MAEPSRVFAGYLPAPTDSAQWRAWLTGTAAEAKQAFDSVADDTPVWDPSGAAAGVPFWSRRLFGEACVHRADGSPTADPCLDATPPHGRAFGAGPGGPRRARR
jgi:Mycothiol maleylpyruvate isomerase N-terminal domain